MTVVGANTRIAPTNNKTAFGTHGFPIHSFFIEILHVLDSYSLSQNGFPINEQGHGVSLTMPLRFPNCSPLQAARHASIASALRSRSAITRITWMAKNGACCTRKLNCASSTGTTLASSRTSAVALRGL